VSEATPLLELRRVTRRFSRAPDLAQRLASVLGAGATPAGVLAVDRVDLVIIKGEVVGLVGESGCGKSTLGRIAAGLLAPTIGDRLWMGQDTTALGARERRASRLAVQMIFQDSYASLNPRLRVAETIAEAPVAHGLVRRAQRGEYVAHMLAQVGLDARIEKRFPHQFSGGQRARINIARALAVRPLFLVCDEAIAALDVSIQAQILNLFLDLRERLHLTYLFISHDLAVVRHVSDRVAIMYLGRVVETAATLELFARPNHPYAQALLAGAGGIAQRKRVFVAVSGEIPSPFAPPPGCHFHPRCPHAMPRCKIEAPLLRQVAPGHLSACHLNELS